mgnify:CR=1 FL=1
MKDDRKLNVITCPYCNREYTPDEIYIPESFLGKTREVLRNIDGSIDIVEYEETPDLTETYVCDKCEKPFIVKANVQFTTTRDMELEKGDYKVPLFKKDRLVLKEE